MMTTFWIVAAVVAVGIITWRLMIPSLEAPIEQAKAQGEATPIVEAVERLRPKARPTAYNHAIKRLWDSYERLLAIELVKVLAEGHSKTLISQYWLQHVQQVEPLLAREHLSQKFLSTYYKPEVAAQCGPVG